MDSPTGPTPASIQAPVENSCCGEEGGCCSNRKEETASSHCGVEEKKGGCCDSDNEISSCNLEDDKLCGSGESECVEQNVDVEDNVDDNSVCNCCIQVLINEPDISEPACAPTQSSDLSYRPNDSDRAPLVVPSKSSPVSDATESAISYLETYASTLRACCKALERYCSRRSCCFTSRTTELLNHSVTSTSSEPSQRQAPDQPKQPEMAKPDVTEAIRDGEKLQLEIRGMNCGDCVLKVERALAQLPSIKTTNLDYFSGIAELRYDQEIITPPAIIAYVARATGFGIRALTTASGDNTTATITLPFSFSTTPPSDALDGFDTHFRPNSNILEVSFPLHMKRPRDVLEHFKAFGAELVPAGSDNYSDIATRDLIDMGVRTVACALLSIPVLVLAWANLPPRPTLYGAISIGFTTLIQGFSFPIVSSAIRSIIYIHHVDLSVLVVVSTLTAYIFSVVSYAFEVAGRPFSSSFFETSALLITLILLGRTAATRRSTGSALRAIQRLQPHDVFLLHDKEAPPQALDARLLYYGDIIRIPPETRIATDGLIVAGSSDVDEISVTGESASVPKQNGSRVIAGTLNLGGTLDVQVTQLHENSLTRIATLINQAHRSRSTSQDLADRLSAIILPIVAVTACITFLVWVVVGHYVRHEPPTSSVVQALTYAIAVLVVSCPCAIILAIPTVISRAIRIGISEGVLFRSADVLHTAYGINVVAFDKTGTLTQGIFTAERVEILVEGAEQIIHALVKDNKHPISQGIQRYLSTRLSPMIQRRGTVTDVVSLPGKGIKASVGGYPLLGGSPVFTGACSHPLSLDFQTSGLTLFTVTLAGQAIAFFGLADTPRPGTDVLVVELVRRGMKVMILSGDTTSAVHRLANAIGVPVDNAYATYTPEDKDAAIVALQAKGQKVCFVGDGTNDGPALSHADVSLAVAAGSDVALGAARAVLIGSDIHRGVLALLDIASTTQVHCRWALAWCIFHNVFAILLASGIFIKARIEPRWAGIGEIVSILPVIGIAFMLDVRWEWRKLCLGLRGHDK